MTGHAASAAQRAVIDPNALLIVLVTLALSPGCDAWGLPVRVPLPQLALSMFFQPFMSPFCRCVVEPDDSKIHAGIERRARASGWRVQD